MRASTEEEEDQHPTPRMNTTATPIPSLAGRLRELIQLVPNGDSTPTVYRPPSPALHESDFEADSTSGGHSHARESLRDIFSKALREPGNTPQRGRPRRDSDSTASESDFLPASSRDLKGKMKSLNNDHSVHSLRKSHVSLFSYLALTGQKTLPVMIDSILTLKNILFFDLPAIPSFSP